MAIRLREAVADDSTFIFDVRRQAFRDYVELDSGWDDVRELERHRERFSRQRFRVIVADSTDVGYMTTAVYSRDTGDYPASLYLHQLMILPAFHGKGIGSACFRLLIDEAGELHMPLRLSVLRVNPRALAFYLAAGCSIVGESDSHISLAFNVR